MNDADLPAFRTAILDWYAAHGRDLPWRRTANPYPIWVSEVMLQQTTVAAVVPYWERFLAAFPTVEALAAAPEVAVLRLWEGLGYYSRARNLHAAAKAIVVRGSWPRTVEGLRELPGVGRYTAGAVASFAFDQPAPIVEANTLRLFARLIGLRDDPRSAAGQAALWGFAERLVAAPTEEARPSTLNQAVMELGGTVCTPKEPRCGACPVSRWCVAFALNAQDVIPPPKARPTITNVTEATIAVRRADGAVLIRQREEGERWAGLWDFPRFEPPAELTADVPPLDGRQRSLPLGDDLGPLQQWLSEAVREQTGVRCTVGAGALEIRHGVTRFRIRLLCFLGERTGGRLRSRAALRWARPADLTDVPLSKTGRQFAQRLADLSVEGGAP
ncbi:A/G-specific adenine glycosylase [Alienimonas californiensis]|uniref:Adenine DNA glycosylase n=1 Tax=Alienimonas californiensis TaxID=2527989 RepID=A0A517PDK2_9PLAN|nr:A/G-specific adenine glycosylase [Alienimonas californiensis]QDT17473.1 putative A/G-specific adenine glycosylase YfhQ [Alienimonas californiensis]